MNKAQKERIRIVVAGLCGLPVEAVMYDKEPVGMVGPDLLGVVKISRVSNTDVGMGEGRAFNVGNATYSEDRDWIYQTLAVRLDSYNPEEEACDQLEYGLRNDRDCGPAHLFGTVMTMPGRRDIRIDRAADFGLTVYAKDVNGTAINLTGCSATAKVVDEPSGTELLEFDVAVDASGVITITAAAEDTEDLDFTRGWWSLDVTMADSSVERFLVGAATLDRGWP